MKQKSSSENLSSSHETESVRKCSDPLTIPVDLLIDIFSRVSAKSIARFRCVSKSWAYLLCRRPDFTELFLSKSSTRPRLFFTLKANRKLFYYSLPQPMNPNENSSLVATRYHKSYPEYFPSDMCTPVCGLVLLQGYRRKVRVICNPATGDFITLPKVLVKPKNLPKAKAKSYPDKIGTFYFGYDPMSKKFKVLCMTSSKHRYERPKRPNTHLVLTLETNGKRHSWRRIENKFHFVRNCRTTGEICINGVLYFGANFDRSTVIVSFDVRSEKFRFINTVQDMSLKGGYKVFSLTLFNYKGKLGIHQKYTVEFWVLEDAGNHKWSKHVYALSPSGKNIVRRNWFVGMTCTGEMVWSPQPGGVSYPVSLFFYNLESQTFTRVNILGFKEFKDKVRIVFYTFLDYVENVIKVNTLSQLSSSLFEAYR